MNRIITRIWHVIIGHKYVDDGPMRIRCACGSKVGREDWP